jgi:hypothetical protein
MTYVADDALVRNNSPDNTPPGFYVPWTLQNNSIIVAPFVRVERECDGWLVITPNDTWQSLGSAVSKALARMGGS